MSADTFLSVGEIAHVLLDGNCASRVWIQRHPSDDVTTAFLAKANHLAHSGAPVCVVCADDVAAQRYRAQLAQYPALESSSICTMQQLALSIAADCRVCACAGREARVLDANEIDVLMEDLKVSGLKPGRLREMFKFFCKSLSEYANEDEGWLITAEEQTVFAILSENLEVRRAMLPCELSSLAYRGMVEAGVERKPLTLLVDDYGSLGKASQRLVDYLATEGLIVAGTTLPAANAVEPYPWVEGFTTFPQRHAATCLRSATDESCAKHRFVSRATPADEFAFVADSVAACLAEGTPASDVLVAAPNTTWLAGVAAALEQRGVAVEVADGANKIKGDPRTEGHFARLKLKTFLQLYINPQDFTALRSWLGFGDWLLRSDAFLELMAFAREHEMDVPCAIERLRTMDDAVRPSTVFGKFDKPLDELAKLMTCFKGELTCNQAVALFESYGMPLSPDEVALLGENPACAHVDALAKHVLAGRLVPTNSTGGCTENLNRVSCVDKPDDAVVVALYRQCHGRHVRCAFITGLVDGFLPSFDAVDDKYTIDHRRSALERDRVLFCDVAATASHEVVCTSFERDLLENAGTLRMQPSRVFMKKGVRYVSLAPSEFAAAFAS